jgi:hypothetical protein
MSDPKDSTENFMQRWSRRKRAAKTPTPEDAAPPRSERRGANVDSLPSASADGAPDLPAFDPTTLPPIESITATSDVRAFLARGVPEELTRAALRHAWMIDPTIRDFVGPAENQWDFTKPEEVPGFGSLELTAELRRIVASLFGDAAGRDTPRPYAKAEQDEELAEISPELSQASTAQTPGGSEADVGRSNASRNVAPSVSGPNDSLPVVPQSSKNAAPQQLMSNDGMEPDDPAISDHSGAVQT